MCKAAQPCKNVLPNILPPVGERRFVHERENAYYGCIRNGHVSNLRKPTRGNSSVSHQLSAIAFKEEKVKLTINARASSRPTLNESEDHPPSKQTNRRHSNNNQTPNSLNTIPQSTTMTSTERIIAETNRVLAAGSTVAAVTIFAPDEVTPLAGWKGTSFEGDVVGDVLNWSRVWGDEGGAEKGEKGEREGGGGELHARGLRVG